jgi:hypothetical protein
MLSLFVSLAAMWSISRGTPNDFYMFAFLFTFFTATFIAVPFLLAQKAQRAKAGQEGVRWVGVIASVQHLGNGRFAVECEAIDAEGAANQIPVHYKVDVTTTSSQAHGLLIRHNYLALVSLGGGPIPVAAFSERGGVVRFDG